MIRRRHTLDDSISLFALARALIRRQATFFSSARWRRIFASARQTQFRPTLAKATREAPCAFGWRRARVAASWAAAADFTQRQLSSANNTDFDARPTSAPFIFHDFSPPKAARARFNAGGGTAAHSAKTTWRGRRHSQQARARRRLVASHDGPGRFATHIAAPSYMPNATNTIC